MGFDERRQNPPLLLMQVRYHGILSHPKLSPQTDPLVLDPLVLEIVAEESSNCLVSIPRRQVLGSSLLQLRRNDNRNGYVEKQLHHI